MYLLYVIPCIVTTLVRN